MAVIMLAQRLVQQSVRRAVTHQPALLRTTALGLNARFGQQSRLVADSSIPASASASANTDQSTSILAKQRLNRPVSPHLGIYRPQITWYLSGLNRVTGCVLSGGFYIFGSAYLVAPLFGWHLGSASLVAAFAGWPLALKLLAKMTIALPFTFHSFNGLRHLVWDMGQSFGNKSVQQTGWAVVGVSVVSALALALM